MINLIKREEAKKLHDQAMKEWGMFAPFAMSSDDMVSDCKITTNHAGDKIMIDDAGNVFHFPKNK